MVTITSMTIDRRQAEGLVVDEMRQSMTLSRIAQTIEISESGMSRKVSGRSPFTESERVKLCRLFGVSLKDWNAKIADKMAQYEGAVPPEPPPDAPRVAAGSPSAAAAYNERHGYQTERLESTPEYARGMMRDGPYSQHVARGLREMERGGAKVRAESR